MADQMSGPVTRCPWCSAELPAAELPALSAPDPERCPSCGATLASATGTEPMLPGVTTLDPEAILRARSQAARPRNRILSFLTGDGFTGTDPAQDPASFAPPSDDVRREMLRLQVEAERADLEAESVAFKADVLARRGSHVSQLGAAEPAAPEGDAGAADAVDAGPADAADTGPAEAGDPGPATRA